MLTAKEIPAWMKQKMAANHFMNLADIEITKVECGYCEMVMHSDPAKHGNRYGAVHGGALFTLADSAMGVVGYSIGAKVVTLSSSINFIRNTMEKETILAKAYLVHAGHSTLVIRVEEFDHTGRKMVDVTGTMFVIGHFDEIPQKW